MRQFLQALSLLTVLPVRVSWREDDTPGRAMWAYPLAGAVIGLLLAAVAWLTMQAWAGQPPSRVAQDAGGLLPAALVLVVWCLLTGGLHLDGWADCCDALFVPAARERRLEILRDPRLGSFGGLGLVLLLLLKLAAIQTVLGGITGGRGMIPVLAGSPLGRIGLADRGLWLLVLVVTPVLARWCLVAAVVAFPLARPDGMAAHFRRGAGRRVAVLATLITAAACLLLGAAGPLLWLAAGVAMLAMARLAVARLGGLTGDVYGAITELAETAVLVVACFLER